MRNNFTDALTDTLSALKLLGVEVNPAPTRREATKMFERVKNEILAVGFDSFLSIPRSLDSRTEIAVKLLNDAGESYQCLVQCSLSQLFLRDKRLLEPESPSIC